MPRESDHLIFTDLDGSLLDHYDYSFASASALLNKLESLGVSVIFATSKTYAELLPIRREIGNRHPFIVENGAAVYIPKHYFATLPEAGFKQYVQHDDFHGFGFSRPRSAWQAILDTLNSQYPGKFVSFAQMGALQIADETGLSLKNAELANSREYSEPLKWLGSEHDKQGFKEAARALGAEVLEGGRFLQLCDDCDKGRAMNWLKAAYQQGRERSLMSIAVGDSHNDVAMLEQADAALVIRSPVHSAPHLRRKEGLHYSTLYGPEGWVEGISKILELNGR